MLKEEINRTRDRKQATPIKGLRRFLFAIYRIAYVLLTLLLVLSLSGLIGMSLNPGQRLPGIFGWSQVVVVSGSMQPAIDPGDLLIIRKASSYEPGDIVTYLEGASLVTHRVIGMDGRDLITQGDANNTEDDPVPLSQVEGKTVFLMPGIGRFILFLQTSRGTLLMTALFILFIAVPWVMGSRRKEEGGVKP